MGVAFDIRSPARRAMGALGLPGHEGPKVPTPRPIAGVVDGTTLVAETTSAASAPTIVTAEVGGNRMRAEVRFGEGDVGTVVLRRCRPARNAADDDCSVDALWEEYLRKNKRRMNRPSVPTTEEIRRANNERSGIPASVGR